MSDDDFSDRRLFFDAVREVAGEAGITALQRTLCGAEIYVPGYRVTERSPLARAIGLDVAREVASKVRVIGADGRVAAGFRVYIGQGPFSIMAQARAAALDALSAGMTRREAARHAGIAERTVIKIIRRYRDETGQADAFPLCPGPVARSRDVPLIAARAAPGQALPLHRSAARGPTPKRQRDAARWAERKARLIAAHAEGMTPGAIAERFGWTVGYVYSQFWLVRRETGLPLLFSRAPGQDKVWGEHIRARLAKIEAAFDEGLSAQKIADRLGISVSTVKNYIAKLRRHTGRPFTFDGPRDHPHTRLGIERRRRVADAYVPGVTLGAIAGRTGLTERAVQGHLARLRRDTGAPFALTRRPHADAAHIVPVNAVTGRYRVKGFMVAASPLEPAGWPPTT